MVISVLGTGPLNHPSIFACLAMGVGLYGILYLEVARVPETGWLIAAEGLTPRRSNWPHDAGRSWNMADVHDRPLPDERLHLVAAVWPVPDDPWPSFKTGLVEVTSKS